MRICLIRRVATTLGLAGLGVVMFIVPVRADEVETKAQICASCHGASGVPSDPAIPVIWGQNEGYLYLQLRDIKRGVRKVEVMGPIRPSVEAARRRTAALGRPIPHRAPSIPKRTRSRPRSGRSASKVWCCGT